MMRRLAPAFPLLFVVLWSTGFIGARLGLPHSEPLTFLFVRYLLVVALLLVLAVLSKAPWPARRIDWLHIGLAGLRLSHLVSRTCCGGLHGYCPDDFSKISLKRVRSTSAP